MEIHQKTEKIWTVPNLLTSKECDDLIIFSEQKGFSEADVGLSSGSKMMKNVRDNYRLIYEDQKLARNLEDKFLGHSYFMVDAMPPLYLNERFRFYRYETGQRFKRHIDGRVKKDHTQESRVTFMVYLNDDFSGGETTFEELMIQPKKGMALLFVHEQKHESKPITDGVKYVLRSDIMYNCQS
ncbi:putative 2-oxoglutarate/Fe(II)-dependent dioxygenase YbiX [Nonlabens dokdonensis]|uniref:Oxidoreductase, 2OG-Fe(II) oxygenase family n=2 Tax=Nonlabens dokdonensis TaxID=328515 RepID=L7W2S0_NONDD|nr:2OG-Fe(II) oxygenase [Nonlabens dokdonensis]AGC75780.1 oxidoreductase, 2OG-Fe(II) oxygenase family [Nonlabens dokdonensis DSW-6]PZX43462.1 putative 2-oxoglutarate/Fe(II)-dependent dioxygenase YbiX [Nonlabens dokdonensis]